MRPRSVLHRIRTVPLCFLCEIFPVHQVAPIRIGRLAADVLPHSFMFIGNFSFGCFNRFALQTEGFSHLPDAARTDLHHLPSYPLFQGIFHAQWNGPYCKLKDFLSIHLLSALRAGKHFPFLTITSYRLRKGFRLLPMPSEMQHLPVSKSTQVPRSVQSTIFDRLSAPMTSAFYKYRS